MWKGFSLPTPSHQFQRGRVCHGPQVLPWCLSLWNLGATWCLRPSMMLLPPAPVFSRATPGQVWGNAPDECHSSPNSLWFLLCPERELFIWNVLLHPVMWVKPTFAQMCQSLQEVAPDPWVGGGCGTSPVSHDIQNLPSHCIVCLLC